MLKKMTDKSKKDTFREIKERLAKCGCADDCNVCGEVGNDRNFFNALKVYQD